MGCFKSKSKSKSKSGKKEEIEETKTVFRASLTPLETIESTDTALVSHSESDSQVLKSAKNADRSSRQKLSDGKKVDELKSETSKQTPSSQITKTEPSGATEDFLEESRPVSLESGKSHNSNDISDGTAPVEKSSELKKTLDGQDHTMQGLELDSETKIQAKTRSSHTSNKTTSLSSKRDMASEQRKTSARTTNSLEPRIKSTEKLRTVSEAANEDASAKNSQQSNPSSLNVDSLATQSSQRNKDTKKGALSAGEKNNTTSGKSIKTATSIRSPSSAASPSKGDKSGNIDEKSKSPPKSQKKSSGLCCQSTKGKIFTDVSSDIFIIDSKSDTIANLNETNIKIIQSPTLSYLETEDRDEIEDSDNEEEHSKSGKQMPLRSSDPNSGKEGKKSNDHLIRHSEGEEGDVKMDSTKTQSDLVDKIFIRKSTKAKRIQITLSYYPKLYNPRENYEESNFPVTYTFDTFVSPLRANALMKSCKIAKETNRHSDHIMRSMESYSLCICDFELISMKLREMLGLRCFLQGPTSKAVVLFLNAAEQKDPEIIYYAILNERPPPTDSVTFPHHAMITRKYRIPASR